MACALRSPAGSPELGGDALRQPDPFVQALTDWDLETLEREEGSVFGLSADLRLTWFSGGWRAFAISNQGQQLLETYPVGRSALDCIPPPLVDWYRQGFARAAETHTPWTHTYECSSPTLFRQFLMTVYPLAAGAGFFLVVNSIVRQIPVGAGPYTPVPVPHPPSGLVVQCAHCRRFRVNAPAGHGDWAWIGPWLNAPPTDVSHSLCVPCMEHHYPGA